MGLDVYVRWDNMTEEERKDQITGFTDAPQAGYMRFNWSGISFVEEEAKRIGRRCPLPLHDYWDGGNGAEVEIIGETVAVLRNEMEDWEEAKGESGDTYFEHKLVMAGQMAQFMIDKFNAKTPGLMLCFY